MQTTGGATLSGQESIAEPDAALPELPGSADAAAPVVGSRRRAFGLLGAVASVILAADVLTKQLAVHQLDPYHPVRLLGGTVYLALATNPGAAFSLLREHTWLFPLLTIAAIGWIGWMSRRLRSTSWALAFGLVLGGAVGNLGDRLFRAPGPFIGEVVDFVSLFNPEGTIWPIFNLADSALCVGLALVLFLEITGRRRDGTRTRAGAADAGSG